MALYQIDRPRNAQFVGKFKFNYQVNVGEPAQFVSAQTHWDTNAGVRFTFNGEEGLVGTVAVANRGANLASILGWPTKTQSFPNFGENAYDSFSKKAIIRIAYDLNPAFDVAQRDFVLIDEVDFVPGIGSLATMSGTVEGYIYWGAVINEFVDIQEFYPAKDYYIKSSVCPDNENQYWYQEELNEKTVRHWPKYTTINWFEAPDRTKKGIMGIFLKITNSKNKETIINRSWSVNPPVSIDYTAYKELNAWTSFASNNGYVSISSNVPFSSNDKQIQAKTKFVTVDQENFSISPQGYPIGSANRGKRSFAKIDLETESSRKVSFNSQIYDWDKPHTDELTAYIVGFGCVGELGYYSLPGSTIPYALPTYEKVVTKSGDISPKDQTYRYYKGDISAQSIYDFNSEFDSKSVLLDTRQKWIYGMIDGASEQFDDLESPPKDYDYPAYWVRSANGCRDINEFPRLRTLDETDLPSGSLSIPIPLRGWKFNAMTLKQDKEYTLSSNGSLSGFGLTYALSFLGSSKDPYYYGSENLSGYRYLKFDIASKNKDSQSTTFAISETSKGFTLSNNSENINEKSWNISIPEANKGKANYVIDLCNPDNKIDFVDNQDSPYPRLNTYTTSKPQSTNPFGYLAVENKPKDDFLITKSLSGDESTTWINDILKAKINNSGIIYLSDDVSKNVDYFEVNTSAFPKAGVGTNIIFGKPRIFNGKIKLSNIFDAKGHYIKDEKTKVITIEDSKYFQELDVFIVKNDITSDKTIDELLNKDSNGNYPDEFQIYNYDFGYPEETDVIGRNNINFIEGSQYIYVDPINILNDNYNLPYDAVIIQDSKKRKVYKFVQYISVNIDKTYIQIEVPSNFDSNIIFNSGSSIKLGFLDGKTDDIFSSIIVKFNKVDKISNNKYKLFIEYSKLDVNSAPNYNGIPPEINEQSTYFSANAPVITVKPPKLVEFNFPVDTLLFTQIKTNPISGNEVNAIDDYPEDEVSNGPYYGVTRIAKIKSTNELVEFENLKLIRNNSLSNFVYSGNNNTFQSQTKFDAFSKVTTEYYTRRFWQQNTDARDEEEGDISWQHTKSELVDSWALFPKSISGLCDDINRKDEYVAPRWLNPNNPSSTITRHPGWVATKIDKSYPTDPITGNRIYSIKLDPEYLNSDTGLATWIYGGGLLAVPSGKNSGSGTTYIKAIDISFNDMKTILAQTIFHRINADFPPGKPDLFGNTSLRNEDGTVQESTLHLRGGFIARGPGHGLILPPQKSTSENLRKANLIEDSTGNSKGSSESDLRGYFQTSSPFGKNKIDHYIELEKTEKFPTPSNFRSSTRNFTQAKRERAAFKNEGVKQKLATNLSACESGFENSIVISYTVPGSGSSNPQTSIIQTDSFFDEIYEIYPVGFDTKSGIGKTLSGSFPFVLSSESIANKETKVHTFLLVENNSDSKSNSSLNFSSVIAANTNMRDKNSWYPYIDGETKVDANFSTLSKAFEGTIYNSYVITDESPEIFNVGYADPGSIIVRSISLNATNIQSPITDKSIFIDGVAPTNTSKFRLLDPIASSGTAVSSFATITQLASRDYLVAYSLKESPRKIHFKVISNYNTLDKNLLLDLDSISGNNLKEDYNIYGLTSSYDEKLGLHRSVFWSNGGIYYFENAFISSSIGNTLTSKLHLIKGKLDDNLVTELKNRNNIITYFESKSELDESVPKQRPAIITCKNESYDGSVIIAYDNGKCAIEAVLLNPFFNIIGTRKFDIECINDSGSDSIDTNGQDKPPIADIQANPTSGQSELKVDFLSTNSYDPNGSILTYAWDFGDGNKSTEENPSHIFVNNTTNPIDFKVTLIVTNSNGIKSDPVSVTITVNPAPVNNLSPQAKFSATPTSGDVILTVTFTDQSTAANDGSFITDYQWDFGDGESVIKFDKNPFTYDYTRSGSFVPKLFVKDNLARLSSTFIGPTINVNGVVNNPPSPSFQWVQTSFTPSLKVQFTDTSSDDEGPLVAWNWNFGDNETSDVQNPEHIYADPGKYRVVLTITDSGGLQVSGTIEITVLPPGNNPPIANFNYSQQNRKLEVDFTDTSTDTDGTIVSWNWDFGDTSSDSLQNPSHTYAFSGTYEVTLKVTDNGGKSSFITKNVTVNPLVNQAPIILNITGNQTSFKPLVVKFTENSSDSDGFITQWNWNFGDRNTFSTTDPAFKNPTNTYQNPGTYTVTLTVTDDGLPDGTNKKTATSFIRFTVAPPPANQPPVALFTVDSNNVFAPATIIFTDASTDADGKIVSWLWEFETGSSLFYNAQTYQKTVSHTFTKSGTYSVKLTVTDDGNLKNTYILDIFVKNNAPIAILTASPNPALSQTQVSFFGNTSYDIDGTIVKYAWDFGDTTIISQGRTIESHTYAKPGTYKASLTVTDNLGDSSTANLFINVTNRSPISRITYTTLAVKAPGSLTFNGDTSSDIDGIIASYSWSVSGSVVATTPNATINFTTQGTYVVSLTVTDDFGATNTSSVTVNVSAPDNILPIAILSVDKNSGVINDTFVFDVTSSRDSDGSIILYILDFGDGTSKQFVNPAPIFHVYKTVGVFTAKLFVTDNRNGVSLETANSNQEITINNQPPKASFSFGPINALTFDPITFIDNSSDPENALSRWSWDFGDGTNFTTTDPLQKNPTKSYSDGNRNYTVTLTVYDNFGLFDSVSQIVFIENRKPFAVISTSSIPVNNVISGTAPFTVTFDSNSYDLDGKVANYEWYINGLLGTPFRTKSFTYTFDTARFIPYSVTLKVQDDDGAFSDLANIGVKVNVPNTPPVAVVSANPQSNSSFAPVSVTFSAAGSYDPDNIGGPLIYAWDFGNSSVSDQVIAATTYSKPGKYTVTLTVTDNLGATNTATLDYIVKNNKPVALLDSIPSGITQVEINNSISFTSEGSYDNDTNQFINGYKWLVDGVNQNSNTPILTTSFNTIGNHNVTLSVFDNLGLESDTVSKTIYVVSTTPPPPNNNNPIAILGNEPTVTGYIELKVGDSYTFDGTNSYDLEDESNITFEWSIDGVKSGYNSTFSNQFNTVGIFTVSLVVFDTQRLSSSPSTNLGNRYTVDVNVSATPNPLSNKLFSTGQALYGAIASGSNTPDRYGFELVDDKKQYTVIEAGLYHTFVVDADGKLYASGSNSNGQLGFPSNVTQLNSLTLVPLASKYKVLRVSAGDLCSAIIAEDTLIGKRVLLVCGSNTNGIFGQALPKTNIYNFQPILERANNFSGASYTSNNGLLDVSCNSYILAFTDNNQVWVAGSHRYTNKTGIIDTGFFPINIDPNPDLQLGSTNYLNPFKLEVGFNNESGFVTGLSYDINNQIVWFTGLSSLRGWGYAYDISTFANEIIIISASTDPYWDHAIVLYGFTNTETPQYNYSPGLASDRNPGETYLRVSTGRFGYLALSETAFYAYGSNFYGALGIAQSYTNSYNWNIQQGLPPFTLLQMFGVVGASDISAGGDHSIVLASNIKPSGYSFTIINSSGYPNIDILTQYPVTQVQQ
jgi:PKD repeat protein